MSSSPNPNAGLPGRPRIEDANGKIVDDIKPGRIVRGRNGKILYFTDALDAKHVADLAGEFFGRDIRRVFFLKKNGERQRQFALAPATGNSLNKHESLVVEAFAWERAHRFKLGRKKVVAAVGRQ